jgi:hypothetical protein
MTLVLTEATSLGIVMAADSSVTLFSPSNRSFVGGQKLLPIRSLNAGVSVWGAFSVPMSNNQWEPMDIWLQRFIKTKINNKMGLWEAAETLASALNSVFRKPLEMYSGMHIAGFDVDEHGNEFPAIYHVHNGHHKIGIVDRKAVYMENESPREFRAHKDHSPRTMREGESFMLRNGDFFVFSVLSNVLGGLFRQLHELIDFSFPYPYTLESRGEYLRFWISLVSQIYRHSNMFKLDIDMPTTIGDAHIGGPISVLTIDKEGIKTFYAV